MRGIEEKKIIKIHHAVNVLGKKNFQFKKKWYTSIPVVNTFVDIWLC